MPLGMKPSKTCVLGHSEIRSIPPCISRGWNVIQPARQQQVSGSSADGATAGGVTGDSDRTETSPKAVWGQCTVRGQTVN